MKLILSSPLLFGFLGIATFLWLIILSREYKDHAALIKLPMSNAIKTSSAGLYALADVTEQGPHVAMERLGMQLVTGLSDDT